MSRDGKQTGFNRLYASPSGEDRHRINIEGTCARVVTPGCFFSAVNIIHVSNVAVFWAGYPSLGEQKASISTVRQTKATKERGARDA